MKPKLPKEFRHTSRMKMKEKVVESKKVYSRKGYNPSNNDN